MKDGVLLEGQNTGKWHERLFVWFLSITLDHAAECECAKCINKRLGFTQ